MEARDDQLRVREGGNYNSKGGGGGGGSGSTAMGVAIGFAAAVGLGLMGKLVTKLRQKPKKDHEVEVLEAVVRGDLARNPSRLAVQMLDLEPQLLLRKRKDITKATAHKSSKEEEEDSIHAPTPEVGLSSLIVNHGSTTNGYQKSIAVKSSHIQKARDATDADADDDDDDEEKHAKDVVADTQDAADTQPQALVNGFRLNEIQGMQAAEA